MAQPNQRPLSAGQRMLEFILDRNRYGLQNSLLGNLNLVDYMNLRGLTQRILNSLDPVVLQTQTLHNPHPAAQPNLPAVPLGGPPGPQLGPPTALPAHPQATNRNDAKDFLRLKLGAHCDDMRKVFTVPMAQSVVPCPNGPTRRVTMGHCTQTNPQSHPPFPTRCFNVCNDCLQSWSVYYHRNITNSLPSRQSTLCKRCSLRLRREQPSGHSTCACRRNIFAGVKCHSCRLDTELATYAIGDARRRTLERTHVKHTGTGSRRRRILYVDNDPKTVRSRAACATPGCGREAWTKHPSRRDPRQHEPAFSKHRDACLMCLCCSGEVVP